MKKTTELNEADRIRPVIDWILEQALTEFAIEEFIAETAEKMLESGYALHRLHITARILHPIYSGVSFTWTQDKPIETDNYRRDDMQSDNWLKSPLRYLLENDLNEYHIKIHAGEGIAEYPIIQNLANESATDYFAYLSRFGKKDTAIERKDGLIVTWACNGDGGWSDQELVDLRRLQSRLAVAVRLALSKSLAENITCAYLGKDAGMRVLSGQIQRGDGEDIDAVVWFSDLRSSTRLAETLGKKEYIKLLNQFFECTAGAVTETEGEILGYIGDSVLAIFPCAQFGGPAEASRQALGAGRLASSQIRDLNRYRASRDEETIGFGIGLHYGTVTYGNIGIPERLSFSVIGSTANEAARITDQCRDLGEEIVVSERFSNLVDGDWRNLGEFQLRNVNYPMTLFAPENLQ